MQKPMIIFGKLVMTITVFNNRKFVCTMPATNRLAINYDGQTFGYDIPPEIKKVIVRCQDNNLLDNLLENGHDVMELYLERRYTRISATEFSEASKILHMRMHDDAAAPTIPLDKYGESGLKKANFYYDQYDMLVALGLAA